MEQFDDDFMEHMKANVHSSSYQGWYTSAMHRGLSPNEWDRILDVVIMHDSYAYQDTYCTTCHYPKIESFQNDQLLLEEYIKATGTVKFCHGGQEPRTCKPTYHTSWHGFYNGRKIKYVIEQVLGWEAFDSWESYLRKYGTNEWNLGAGKRFTTPTPVAFYDYYRDGIWRIFSKDHQELDEFDPLTKIQDAWKIIDWTQSLADNMRRQFDSIVERLLKKAYKAQMNGVEPQIRLDFLATITPELLCQTAYLLITQNEEEEEVC